MDVDLHALGLVGGVLVTEPLQQSPQLASHQVSTCRAYLVSTSFSAGYNGVPGPAVSAVTSTQYRRYSSNCGV